jgi:intein/homing endonuclease
MRKLVSIKEVEKFPLYDITVENDHCFELENGIIAHNSMYPKAIVSGGCVVAGTEIQTPGGLKKIEDFSVGEKVITLSGDQVVTHVWNPDTLEEGNPECYEITFEDGYTVTVSDKHKFLIGGKWIEARNLIEGLVCTTVNT